MSQRVIWKLIINNKTHGAYPVNDKGFKLLLTFRHHSSMSSRPASSTLPAVILQHQSRARLHYQFVQNFPFTFGQQDDLILKLKPLKHFSFLQVHYYTRPHSSKLLLLSLSSPISSSSLVSSPSSWVSSSLSLSLPLLWVYVDQSKVSVVHNRRLPVQSWFRLPGRTNLNEFTIRWPSQTIVYVRTCKLT